jgi:curved DNA-binding protein CbpA
MGVGMDDRRDVNSEDPYEILGLPKSSSLQQIEKQYRKLALQFHPDKNDSPGAEDMFKKINQAHETLITLITNRQKSSSEREKSQSRGDTPVDQLLIDIKDTIQDFYDDLCEPHWAKKGTAGLFSKQLPTNIGKLRDFVTEKLGDDVNGKLAAATLENLKDLIELVSGIQERLADAKIPYKGLGKRDPLVDEFYKKWHGEFSKLLETRTLRGVQNVSRKRDM